ncbi:NUDIX hydrolase [Parendozoicomonas haliclonae]|uniref:Putative Nudix hydrolase YfcD n=1 Tax=Parendozoicomonas haliclonae TaxID=1960125 RepID=A0A1X7AP41_9GAMM|nr:NUDIX domain-containing protein [Parendozoicomonas haliclonae]SMA49860.1 putative Nudix hydrolase YfcD [Parendozoicomonas haliclonae]
MSEHDHPINAYDEQVVVVDMENNIIGSEPRSKVRDERLCHRATFVFIFTSSGQLVFQERTLTKDVWPGFYDLAAGGVVAAGEEYDVAAARELEEEMGVRDVALEPRFHFYYQDDGCCHWGKVYTCVWDGEIIPQPEEVARVVTDDPDRILANPAFRSYTPDSFLALQKLKNDGVF